MRRSLAHLLLAALAGLAAAPYLAHAHAENGTPVPAVELTAVSGEKVKLLDPRARVTVLVFAKTGQERSVDALKAMAGCEQRLAGKGVRFVGILPSGTPAEEGRALAQATGVRMPLLLDAGDAIYESLQVRLHPVVFLVDSKGRLAAFELYRQIDYCDVIMARIRFQLGEIDQAALDRVLEPPRNTMPGDDPRDVARRDVNLGRRQLEIKQYDKALASANKALALAPSPGAFALIGDVAAARGDCAAARKQYQAALRLDSKEPHALEGMRRCAGR